MDKQIRVLLIDDNDDDASLIIRELRKHRFNTAIRHVRSGSEFYQALDDHHLWDVVVTDFSLPDTNGLVVTRASEPKTRTSIIVLSGAVGEEISAALIKAGLTSSSPRGNSSVWVWSSKPNSPTRRLDDRSFVPTIPRGPKLSRRPSCEPSN